jgi:hypothetical protein
MGIARGMAKLFLDHEAKIGQFSGSVLELGRQELYFNLEQVREWAMQAGVPLNPVVPKLSHHKSFADKGWIDDVTFLTALGFNTVESLDVSDYENCTHVHDLNKAVPESLWNRYDVIINGGTLEHLFDVPMALQNIHKMLKVGGQVLHLAPSTNHVDHGFYMFSPMFFHEYYEANRYQIERSLVIFYTPKHDTELWKIFTYEPGNFDSLSYGGFDKGNMLAVYMSARKSPESVSDIVPQQGDYRARRGGPNYLPKPIRLYAEV